MKRAKDIMNTDVIHLSPDDSVFDAAELFSKKNISGAPVVENERLVGMMTVTDIIKFINIKIENPPEVLLPAVSQVILAFLRTLKVSQKFDEEMKRIKSLKVRDVMATEPITVNLSTNFLEIAKIMDEHKIHRLPVISRNKLVGIITTTDVMRTLVEPKKSKISTIKRRLRRRKSS